MSEFICNHCDATLQKRNVRKHYNRVCLTREYLKCTKCLKHMGGLAYLSHKNCQARVKNLKTGQRNERWAVLMQWIIENELNLTKQQKNYLQVFSRHKRSPQRGTIIKHTARPIFGRRFNEKIFTETWNIVLKHKHKLGPNPCNSQKKKRKLTNDDNLDANDPAKKIKVNVEESGLKHKEKIRKSPIKKNLVSSTVNHEEIQSVEIIEPTIKKEIHEDDTIPVSYKINDEAIQLVEICEPTIKDEDDVIAKKQPQIKKTAVSKKVTQKKKQSAKGSEPMNINNSIVKKKPQIKKSAVLNKVNQKKKLSAEGKKRTNNDDSIVNKKPGIKKSAVSNEVGHDKIQSSEESEKINKNDVFVNKKPQLKKSAVSKKVNREEIQTVKESKLANKKMNRNDWIVKKKSQIKKSAGSNKVNQENIRPVEGLELRKKKISICAKKKPEIKKSILSNKTRRGVNKGLSKEKTIQIGTIIIKEMINIIY